MPDPITAGFLLKTLGPPVASAGANWLLSRIGGSPQRKGYEQFIQQQAPILEQLRLQAMGKPSTASRFLESRLQQAARQSRQAEAATSTRQGLGQQSSIARQRQIDLQTNQTLADLLGQLQLGAQQQYGGLMGQIGGMKAGMAEAEMAAQQRMAATVGQVIENIFAEYYKDIEKTGQRDENMEKWDSALQNLLSDYGIPPRQRPWQPLSMEGGYRENLLQQLKATPRGAGFTPLSERY